MDTNFCRFFLPPSILGEPSPKKGERRALGDLVQFISFIPPPMNILVAATTPLQKVSFTFWGCSGKHDLISKKSKSLYRSKPIAVKTWSLTFFGSGIIGPASSCTAGLPPNSSHPPSSSRGAGAPFPPPRRAEITTNSNDCSRPSIDPGKFHK